MNLAAIVLCILVSTISVPVKGEASHIGIFKNTSGEMHVIRDGTALDAQMGMRVLKSDTVRSGISGSAGIVFKDGTLLTIGPASHIVIRDYVFDPQHEKYAFSLYLREGTTVYSSGNIAKLAPKSVTIATPRATVGVRGTRFILTAD